MKKTEEQEFSNSLLNLILLESSSLLSIIGSLLIIVSYLLYKDIRTPSRHIIVCMSISDLVYSTVNFLDAYAKSPNHDVYSDLCVLSSFMGSTAILWSFFWAVALSIFLNVLIVQKDPVFADTLIHKVFHPVCWLIPLIINVFALCFNKLGNTFDFVAPGWCWIEIKLNDVTGKVENRGDAIFWMTLNYKGIEILTYLTIALMYLRIKCHLKDKIKNFENSERKMSTFVSPKSVQAAKTTDRKLIFIPIMLVLLRIWGTIRYILFIIQSKDGDMVHLRMSLADKAFLCLQTVGDNLIGAVNCVLFCFLTPKVWNHLKESMSNMKSKLCCNKKQEIILDPDEKTKLISQSM
ncbi:G-protein coupled receptor 157-like [Clytia hemisphaerica]|uniref:G-protein coupled receptors family 2 profile 2 domain-containing protein n=1 Tax=Clytia hemisphaerica TaxID=252671 RepID=A0A7M5UR93_9CNID